MEAVGEIAQVVLGYIRIVALKNRRHPDGASGDWFIDDRCMGCGSSRAIAPGLIGLAASGGQFVFLRQPETDAEVVLAQHAAEVCPTRSIGTESGLRWRKHHPVEITSGVWRTGSNAPHAAGGNAFLVQRAAGNLLVDGPRYTPALHRALETLGGVSEILITHRDDVGDAERLAVAFGAEVVVHHADRDAAPHATRTLTGDRAVEVAPGMLAIPTPGHTEGHVMYLLDDATLFSGDSLAWDPQRDDLRAERWFCWWSWPAQLDSLQRLTRHSFTRVVPTHGAISPDLSPDEMRNRLGRLVTSYRQKLTNGLGGS